MQFLFSNLFSQEPFYYVIGADELASTEIYGIERGYDGRLYLATNRDLIIYDGYNFSSHSCPEALSSSVFNLSKDENGSIYYNNLNGQIFKFDGKIVELIHQVDEKDLSAYLSFVPLGESKLLIHGAALYQLDLDAQTKRYIYPATYHTELSILEQRGDTTLINFWKDSITYITPNNYFAKPLKDFKSLDSTVTRTFDEVVFKGEEFFKNLGKGFYSTRIKENEIEILDYFQGPNELTRIYTTTNAIWYASNKSGVYVLTDIRATSFNKVLNEFFVSFVYEDSDGTIFLGTFNNGVIVIPPINTKNYNSFQGEKAISFDISQKAELFVGTNQGNILKIGKSAQTQLINTSYKEIEFLDFFDEDDLLFYDSIYPKIFDFKSCATTEISGGGAIKGITKIGSNFFIASNVSSYVYDFSNQSMQPIFFGRSRVTIATHTDTLIGTNQGIYVYYLNKAKEIRFQENSVLANAMIPFEDDILIGASKQGVLRYCKQKLIPFSKGDEYSFSILELHHYKEYIIANCTDKIRIYNSEGDEVDYLSYSDGLIELKCSQTRLLADTLYCLNNSGIQTVTLSLAINNDYKEKIKDIFVWVNNQKKPNEEKLILPHHRNRIKFEIIAPSYNHFKDVSYEYRIKELESDWNRNEYSANIIDYKTVPPGDYTFEIRLLIKDKIVDYKEVRIQIKNPFWRTIWFALLILIVVILVLIFFFRIRISKLRKRNQELIEKEQMKSELLNSKLTKLRSQMNPHFIFNSLNAIQELVLKQDTENSYDYIVLFSQLVRTTLNNSDKDFNSIDEEIEFLMTYLKLEKLRFNEEFEFQIDCTADRQTLIPTFFVQPFVENALLHGLLHKDGLKTLKITFREEEDFILCCIEDNGIGREESQKINERTRKSHRSFSLNAVEERSTMFSKRSGANFSFEIIDKYDENNTPKGTKVIIKLPVKG